MSLLLMSMFLTVMSIFGTSGTSANDDLMYLTTARDTHSNEITTSIPISVFISVKTSSKFHSTRLDLILKTWYNYAPDHIYFFTDSLDSRNATDHRISSGHLIPTNCSSSHNRRALCCKMSIELDTFLKSKNSSWFCHFDDDNYVNVPVLLQLLESYDPQEDWYLGKPSIRAPLQILDRKTGNKIGFWFATGGAGFCLSRSLVMRIIPPDSGPGKFVSIGDQIRLPDDVTVGYIIEYLLRKPLTVIEQFHSHLEPMKFIRAEALKQQISFSYSKIAPSNNNEVVDGGSAAGDAGLDMNVVSVPYSHVTLDPVRDPTR